jgi:hypothetical protein
MLGDFFGKDGAPWINRIDHVAGGRYRHSPGFWQNVELGGAYRRGLTSRRKVFTSGESTGA